MKENFLLSLKDKTEKELNIIVKDHVFYSLDERNAAIQELENRDSKIDNELKIIKKSFDQSKKDKSENYYKITFKDLLPKRNYLFTPFIIYLNVFIYILMVLFGTHSITPEIEVLISWGGNLRDLTLTGQYWRLLSSIFLHGGVFHLVFNMYALLYAGALLEPAFGKGNFLFTYLLSGLFANLASLAVNENNVSIGASGAIFGIYGILITFFVFRKIKIPDTSSKSLLLSIVFFVGYNLLYGFKEQGIDNAAHIGGLLSGFVIGLAFLPIFQHIGRTKIVSIGLGLFFLFCFFITIKFTPNKLRQFNHAMQEFLINEKKALWMYQENLSNIQLDKSDFEWIFR